MGDRLPPLELYLRWLAPTTAWDGQARIVERLHTLDGAAATAGFDVASRSPGGENPAPSSEGFPF